MPISTRLKKRKSTSILLIGIFFLTPHLLHAQGEPEAPKLPEKLVNGWQLSAFTGLSYNVFGGGYAGDCPCIFLATETSASMPFGASLSIPLFSDLSLYVRGGVQNSSTKFFTGRNDSLRSTTGVGEIGDELVFDYNLLQLDVLVRLIGRMDGERVFVGPSFGFVKRQHVRITETEYKTGWKAVLHDQQIEEGRDVRVSLVIGAEYAFIPFRNLYVIPSLQVDYSPQRVSEVQPLRPVFYKAFLSIAYQLF